MHLRTSIFTAALVFFAQSSIAQDMRLQKAGAVVEALLDVEGKAQIRLAVEDMLRQTQDYDFRSQYQEFFEALIRLPEYKAARAKGFADAFSESELDQLLVLFRNPVFRSYQERTPELQRLSRAALVEVLRPRAHEFSRRIELLKQSGAKTPR